MKTAAEKIEQIEVLLKHISCTLVNQNPPIPPLRIRELIDERRQLCADLMLLQDPATSRPSVKHCLHFKADNFASDWSTRRLDDWAQPPDFENQEFCNRFIDKLLPLAWDFSGDLIVLTGLRSMMLYNCLKKRGQKNIIILPNPEIQKTQLYAEIDSTFTHICESSESLTNKIAHLQISGKQILTIPCSMHEQLPDEHRPERIREAVEKGKRILIENAATAAKFGKSWSANVIRNLQTHCNAYNFHQLFVTGASHAVIVGAGPSLEKNIDVLRKAQEKVFIISALRSLPVLSNYGVDPDIVIQLDAEDNQTVKNLDLSGISPIRHLLLESFVNPGFSQLPAKTLIWSLPPQFFDVHKHFGTEPTPFSAPSVSIYGLFLSKHLGFKNIAFVGQDLAMAGDKEYAQGATSLIPSHTKNKMFQLTVPGYYGGHVKTRASYEFQILRCSELAQIWLEREPDVKLVNATEGGAMIPNFKQLPLREFVRELDYISNTKKEVRFRESPPKEGRSPLDFLDSTRKKLLKIHDISKKINGSLEVDEGIDTPLHIKRLIDDFRSLNSSTSFLQINMQQELSKIIGTSREPQKISSFREFFSSVELHASELINTIEEVLIKKSNP